jgi:hypothetical protein
MSLIVATAPNLMTAATGGLTSAQTLQTGLLAGVTLASGANAVYTPAAKTAAIIDTASLCNHTVSPVIVTVTITPAGGSAFTVLSAYSLAAGDTITAADVLSALAGLKLGPGDSIGVNAGAATSVDFVASGSEAVRA